MEPGDLVIVRNSNDKDHIVSMGIYLGIDEGQRKILSGDGTMKWYGEGCTLIRIEEGK